MRIKNKKLLIVILICIVVLLLSSLQILQRQSKIQQLFEYFLPQLSYIVDEKKDLLEIVIDEHVLTDTTLSIVNTSKNIKIAQNSSKYGCRITDAFSILHYDHPNTLFLSAFASENVYLVVISPVTNTKSWINEPYTIGYTNDIEKDLLTIVINSLSTIHRINLKKVIKHDTTDEAIFAQYGIDAICYFANIKTIKINNDFKFQLIDYADMVDMKKMAIILPYALRTTNDFSLWFQQLKGKRAMLKSVISFDAIIVANRKVLDMNVNSDLHKILVALNSPTKINFYQFFLPVLPISLQYAKAHSAFIEKRDKLQILEQFQEMSIPAIQASKIVDGFFDIERKTFTIKGTSIDSIDMTKGMKVTLQHQRRPYENGSYIVKTIQQGETVLLQQNMFNTQQNNDFSFVCYGDNSIKSKALCESPFNELGGLKSKQTTWDRPCTIDVECPFFQSNKNYSNYRGGCIDGRCEMPIGVRAIGFRKHEPDSNISCHGCIDATTTFCCKEQLDKTLYPHLRSPDYAFEMDYFERLHK
jgi:hypothetical protein